jgi:multiple sugar transport system ATP-binding protein
MALVVFENVSKVFSDRKRGTVPAVKEFSLTIANGELMTLLGPSGSGKTTVLRLLAGLEQANSGTISIDGRIINDLPPRERDVAMVFQDYALYPHLTAFENIALPLKLRRLPPEDIDRRVRAASAAIGLTSLLDRLPEALSGGERQRVAVGRALVRQPKVFLLDEPLSNLDATLRLRLRVELKRLQAHLGATMLYVTHDQVEAMTMGHRLAVLRDGQIQQVGEPLEVYHRPANLFVAGFVGSPPMNLIRGLIQAEAGGIRFSCSELGEGGDVTGPGWGIGGAQAPALALLVGKPVILGLRPEAIKAGESHGPGHSLPCLGLSLTVHVVDPLGGESLVHGSIGRVGVTVRWPTDRLPVPSQSLPVWIDFGQARYFDPATGLAIA